MERTPAIADESQRLHTFVRDLVALSAIPALWIGRPPSEIALGIRDLLSRMLDLDLIHVELRDPESGRALTLPEGQMSPVEPASRNASPDHPTPAARDIRVASFSVGLHGDLGAISVGARRSDFPGELDSMLLQFASNQAGVALHNAELLCRHERAEQQLGIRAEQQAVAVRLGLRALTGVALDQLFHETVEAVREILLVDFVEILELQSVDEVVLLKAGIGWRPGLVGSSRFTLESRSDARHALLYAEPLIVADARLDERFSDPPLLRQHGVTSGVTVIIQDQARPYGVLAVHTRDSRAFNADHVQFLQLIANILGVARQRSRAEAEREDVLARTAEARAAAERASRTTSKFLATMSHELRTPLNAISGYVQLLEMEVHGPVTEAQRDDLARIARCQTYLLGLVNNVLAFVKLGSGTVQFDIVTAPLDSVLDSVEELTRPQMDTNNLRYERRTEAGIHLCADVEKLQQILVNLLSNAVKFTASGGSVSVASEVDEETVRLRVEDSGRGIPQDRLESIFEPFVQIDDHPTVTREGTGLGLAISREYARAMGGDLTAESSAGRGSVFTLVLPRGRGGRPAVPLPTALDTPRAVTQR